MTFLGTFPHRFPDDPDQQQAEKGQPVVEILPEQLHVPGHRHKWTGEMASAANGQEPAILERPVDGVGHQLHRCEDFCANVLIDIDFEFEKGSATLAYVHIAMRVPMGNSEHLVKQIR